MKKAIFYSIVLSQLLFLLLFPLWISLTKYLNPVLLVVMWMLLTLTVFYSVFAILRIQVVISWRLVIILYTLYSIGLIVLLFNRPSDQVYETVNIVPFATILFYLSGEVPFIIAFYNLAANIGLFVPFGFLLMVYHKEKHARKVLLSIIPILVVSIIEGTQFLTRRGSLDIDDFILNVLGFLLGYVVYPFVCKVVEVKR